ncbi:MAG TPA: type II secretion system secretin GspD [Azospirillum sp.]|nr:type II secretion system secretin GspD [Azospirillum sp.]
MALRSGSSVVAPATPILDRGTGVYVRPPAAPVREISQTPSGELSLNFVDTDIRDFTRTILGDVMQANYTIDPRIQGSVTVDTRRPVSRAYAMRLLESVLEINGAALVQTPTGFRVLPVDEAGRGGSTLQLGPTVDPSIAGFRVQVVPLRYVEAANMQKLLQPMLPKNAVISADEATNVLMMGGTRPQIESLLSTVEAFDVDRMRGMSIGLFPLQVAQAGVVTKELETVFGPDQKAGAQRAGGIRFTAVERLNAVLAVASQPAMLDRASSWITRLDQGKGTSPQLHVYNVQHGRASGLAKTLQQIFASNNTRQPPSLLAPGLDPVMLAAGYQMQEPGFGAESPALGNLGGARSPAGPDGGAMGGGGTGAGGVGGGMGGAARSAGAAPPVQGGTSHTAAPRGGDGSGGSFSGTGPTGSPLRVIADESRNALVILSTPADNDMIMAAIRRLDVPPLQVLIEATIAEVTLNDELRYGLQWFFRSGQFSFTQSNSPTGSIAQSFPGLSVLFNNTPDARVVLNAVSSITDVKVISSPQVLALNNERARLQVGDSVPIAVQSAVSVLDPDAPVVNTIQFRDTGVTLEVTPRVNAGGRVILDIEQDVSDAVRTTTSGIDSPTIQQRKIQSTVAVQSGETVGLGGLIRDGTIHGNSGLPILSQLPVVGPLFGTRTEDGRRTELLVLLTPRVVQSQQELRDMTNELRSKALLLSRPAPDPGIP